MTLFSLTAVVLTAVALVVVTRAALAASRSVDPTLRAIDRLRGDLQPALVRVRAERERAAQLRHRR